jgi:uncharacterized membrane protein YuzA (DUF378 family)
MKMFHWITWGLIIIGGLNWGLAAFNKDIATWGFPHGLLTTVYILIGLSALYELFTHGMRCRMCNPEGKMGKMPM